MINKLKLKNFTVFQDLEIDFSSNINIIIGENGTGKTHLLKAAYALCSANNKITDNAEVSNAEVASALTDKLIKVFMPQDHKLGKISTAGVSAPASIMADFVFGKSLNLSFSTRSKSVKVEDSDTYIRYSWNPVFIPAKEVLSLLKGFGVGSADKKVLDVMFDDTYFDLANALLSTENSTKDATKVQWIAEDIVNEINGQFTLKGKDMLFRKGQYIEYKASADQIQKEKEQYFKPEGRQSFGSHMVAEGFRKFGVIQVLLQNGILFPGISGSLFWDEPEANLNPKLMRLMVNLLLELSRSGQQIIIATHDYVLLKWFDLLFDKSKNDHIRYHSLRHEDGSVKIKSVDDYALINKSAISDTFAELYDEDIKRALE